MFRRRGEMTIPVSGIEPGAQVVSDSVRALRRLLTSLVFHCVVAAFILRQLYIELRTSCAPPQCIHLV